MSSPIINESVVQPMSFSTDVFVIRLEYCLGCAYIIIDAVPGAQACDFHQSDTLLEDVSCHMKSKNDRCLETGRIRV